MTEFTDELLRNGDIRAHDGDITDHGGAIGVIGLDPLPILTNHVVLTCVSIYVALTSRYCCCRAFEFTHKHAIPD